MVTGTVCSSRVGFPKILRSMPLLHVAALFCVLMTGTFNGTNETGQRRRAVIPDLNELPTFDDNDDEGYESSVVDEGNVVNGNADNDGDDDSDRSDNDDDNDGGGDEDLEPSSSDDERSDDDDDDERSDDDDGDGSAEDREDHGEDDDSDDDEDDAVLAIGFYMKKK